MKSLWKYLTLLAVLVLAVSACGPAPAPATDVEAPSTGTLPVEAPIVPVSDTGNPRRINFADILTPKE